MNIKLTTLMLAIIVSFLIGTQFDINLAIGTDTMLNTYMR